MLSIDKSLDKLESKIREERKEIIKLTSAKLLISLFEAVEITAKSFFKASPIYRQSMKKYYNDDRYDKAEINDRIQYLKSMGFIKTFTESRERFVELSPKGFKKLKKLSAEIKIDRPKKWDKKWRMVIFDVPEKFRSSRNSLRFKLLSLGLIKIQKSVYVYPFPCTDEIVSLSRSLGIEKSVTVMVADIIQGEEEIIYRFLKTKTLNQKDLEK
ncbi:hypothetical protein AUJ40_02200 [Candidatus Berkelbacteria bacterium CG1_02_42_45]|uniref:Transcriptional repressor PaaX-like central Cas2-like domain-containing protein n=4 Tax=Candidatus Berkelbacteria TaxID=1618330 RepID=A0A2M7K1J8_9BACT|nr:MAG: hypothetical protein AUJ40_02200 [Candidatus Berkelbacteria bacterium CG1_02_42_45]PIP50952.1 MAG: hypothetical protein COX11_01315 [Candidatus Berkelbacteria bacterium CG23_combo_of_CG06-09_8_20_14_all_41_73]PIX30147.1 MAG: hypothetical protein COZ63_01255 [Candidatus Berkelbacteria bacterium CG_4_8_14_3_um_filter_42_13]PIZ27607.1 MAG: hypothetical protein COY45_01575 [Candidatus Berkelbacteria bacterium CG_4_10_14_0_8_um_filter_42_34]